MDPASSAAAGAAADTIQKYGGWGAAFMLIPVVVWLVRALLNSKDEHAAAIKALRDGHEMIVATLRDAHAKVVADLNAAHAAEIARLNDKRMEDARAVLSAVGQFEHGRVALVDGLDQLRVAITENARAVIAEIKDRTSHLWPKQPPGGGA